MQCGDLGFAWTMGNALWLDVPVAEARRTQEYVYRVEHRTPCLVLWANPDTSSVVVLCQGRVLETQDVYLSPVPKG